MELSKIIGAALMLPLISVCTLVGIAILYTEALQISARITIVHIVGFIIGIAFIIGGALYFDNDSDKK